MYNCWMGLRRNLPNCSGIFKPSSNIQFRLTGFLSKPLTIKLNHPDTMNESVGDQRYQVVNLMQLVYHVTIILCASLRHYCYKSVRSCPSTPLLPLQSLHQQFCGLSQPKLLLLGVHQLKNLYGNTHTG